MAGIWNSRLGVSRLGFKLVGWDFGFDIGLRLWLRYGLHGLNASAGGGGVGMGEISLHKYRSSAFVGPLLKWR